MMEKRSNRKEMKMKRMKRLCMPVLLGVLLMATLVGVAGARPNARPEASPQLQNYTISAHHCIPVSDTTDFALGYEHVQCNSTVCALSCPIKPPTEKGMIRAQRLAMWAYDNAAGDVCIYLIHLYPKTSYYVFRLYNECSTDSANDPQVYAYNPANFKVSPTQDLHVSLEISGSGQKLYAFKLRYEPL
jgi:hypothetical protein